MIYRGRRPRPALSVKCKDWARCHKMSGNVTFADISETVPLTSRELNFVDSLNHGPWYAEAAGLSQHRATGPSTKFLRQLISQPLTTYRAVLRYLDRFKYRVLRLYSLIGNVKCNTSYKAWINQSFCSYALNQQILHSHVQVGGLVCWPLVVSFSLSHSASFNSFKIINSLFTIALYMIALLT